MVDQHSGVSLTELEQSILETIEADAEYIGAGNEAADADTSSFILDGGTESPQAPLPHQHRSVRDDLSMREQQKRISSAIGKGSPQASSSRPRASTEVSVRFFVTKAPYVNDLLLKHLRATNISHIPLVILIRQRDLAPSPMPLTPEPATNL